MIRIHKPVGFIVGLASLLVSCVGDQGVAPSGKPATETLGAMSVAPLNAVMAVGDTLSLTVRGWTLSGTPIASFDSVQYFLENVTDSLRARVSTSGVVTALSPSLTNNPVLIEVIGFKHGVARADQAVVQITATRFSGATLSIHPIAPDSAKLGVGSSKTIVPTIRNTLTGQSVSNPTLRLEYGPGDSTKLQCYRPNLVATGTLTMAQLSLSVCGGNANTFTGRFNSILVNQTGVAWVIAEATVYGVVLRDSVQYTLTNPVQQILQIGASNFGLAVQSGGASASATLIAPGSTIYFRNTLNAQIGASLTITFDDPSAATVEPNPLTGLSGGTTGNITPITSGQFAARKFLTAGVYTWTATVLGGIAPLTGETLTGRITVQ